ncbi:Protein kinase-like (PK-like) [Glarea lozoyensis ATCC 20868]|uniref:Protein kinase-like (PK-like) n=1 Tax=Glarea lozoyensis (strain ATCC 20868 / MF5171) TaxID=1116229 RepID=S3D6U2_GLAL2|nr:Protein kinase-like (PK-like) [Glarea lozoyensis ATCC 20868]EPE33505.1 Protein kinase-like (PK-like) [Glarea lozoyensis ATCC 20868]
MADRNVTPDPCLLQQIFKDSQPKNISMFVQTWDKCVFKAEFSKDESVHPSCVVRIEAENKNLTTFATTAAMQQIARIIIPHLVPQTLQIGKATNEQKKLFNFSVSELVDGPTLADVWHDLDDIERNLIINDLTDALIRLNALQLNDGPIKAILLNSLGGGEEEEIWKGLARGDVFGGLHTGVLNEGPALLTSIMENLKLKKTFCTMETLPNSQDVKIQSNFDELGSLIVRKSDMDQWLREAVFCHNDLTPRNLILKKWDLPGGKKKYKLAGIIDWESAGFYPPSYELSLQDTYLGRDRHASFYLMLKANMKELAPRTSSQIALLKAMELMYESQQRRLVNGTNVPAHLRQRFLECLGLTRDDDPYAGWTPERKEGKIVDFSSTAMQRLKDDIVQEMEERRKSKAK